MTQKSQSSKNDMHSLHSVSEQLKDLLALLESVSPSSLWLSETVKRLSLNQISTLEPLKKVARETGVMFAWFEAVLFQLIRICYILYTAVKIIFVFIHLVILAIIASPPDWEWSFRSLKNLYFVCWNCWRTQFGKGIVLFRFDFSQRLYTKTTRKINFWGIFEYFSRSSGQRLDYGNSTWSQ